MLSQLDGSTERQTQSPAQTRVKSLKQSIISFPCSHNCFSVFQNPCFKNHTDSYTEQETETELLSSLGLHRAGLCRPHARHCLGLRESFQSSAPYTAHGFPEKSHNCASREADRKTLLLFISSEHGGGPEGKQKGHKRRCLKVSSPSILPPPDSELSLLTETVSKRKFQPK